MMLYLSTNPQVRGGPSNQGLEHLKQGAKTASLLKWSVLAIWAFLSQSRHVDYQLSFLHTPPSWLSVKEMHLAQVPKQGTLGMHQPELKRYK